MRSLTSRRDSDNCGSHLSTCLHRAVTLLRIINDGPKTQFGRGATSLNEGYGSPIAGAYLFHD